jgi:hypothetical protein
MPDLNFSCASVPDRSGDADEIGHWSLIVAVKDKVVLKNTLLRSPAIDSRCQVITKLDYSSAAKAYNDGTSEANNETLVFVHTDVYLPEGWLNALARSLNILARIDPHWGVLGVCGISKTGDMAGHVYSTGSRTMFGEPFEGLVEAISLDELLLVTRRSASLRFDEHLPGFHLYGTDICQEASRRGMKSYIMSAFCIHNSNGVRSLPFSFWRAYFYLRRKWWSELPVRTCCTELTKGYWLFIRSLRTHIRQLILPTKVGTRCSDPEKLYRDLLEPRSS